MFVSRSMARKVITADKEKLLLEAQKLMQRREIRHLPIVDDNDRLIGMVTDRDIRSALPYLLAKGDGDDQACEKYAHESGRYYDHRSADDFPESYPSGCHHADRAKKGGGLSGGRRRE